jgi:hypothetical protein
MLALKKLLSIPAVVCSQFQRAKIYTNPTIKHDICWTLPIFRTIPFPSCQGRGCTFASNASQSWSSHQAKQEQGQQKTKLFDEAKTIK